MIRANETAGVTVRVAVETSAVPDHVKFHIRRNRQIASEPVVEKPELALRCEFIATYRGANSAGATHQRSPVRYSHRRGGPVLS
ncbi:MAG: hypothetical protein M3Y83_04085, partial [Actinomycetota bacterium]|nr:hypothetical protein [Actinomycetota bacterium]